ncbi:MAG: ATP synthase F1 subunit delta [Luteolibacter sp.]
MKISKVAAASARRLFGMCQVNGQLDDNKLRELVSKLIELKPRDYQAMLASIQRLTRLEVERRQVVVESATPLSATEGQNISAGLAKDYGDKLDIKYKITPELLGGVRIQVGDDVLDGSVQGRLDRLSKAF